MKEKISASIKNFSKHSLTENALEFFKTLGYESDRQQPLDDKTFGDFQDRFISEDKNFDETKALTDDWKYVDFLFQLTENELNKQQSLLISHEVNERITSYLFFTIELSETEYSRTKLSEITRQVNKLFQIPAMILFKYGEFLTLSVIDRRPNKKDDEKDVLEKVTLIKDISIENPHRGHIEILSDLALINLQDKFEIKSFLDLHTAWRNTLNISNLNKKFYKQIIEWFDWAVSEIRLPDIPTKSETHKDFAIRLIARLVFVWFLKELRVIDSKLLEPKENILVQPNDSGSAYYKFILQNLFFNALNKQQNERKEFEKDFDIYASYFDNPDKIYELIGKSPFLNGGLFDEEETDFATRNSIINNFSVPDKILIGTNGLNTILERFKFTVAENTPTEEEIAVEPDMLGRIFENLLAEQTDDTKEAARKNAGAFYTPRPIVSYMCKNVLLRHLDIDIIPENGKEIVHKLLTTTVIDPACGSGAFPLGMLEEMMNVLQVADPEGVIWSAEMMKSRDDDFRNYIADFVADKQVRYVQKLGLLRNCLYGVDLLGYAVEITKLRCWLSLIVEQKVDFTQENYNLKPLPNLEFKFYEKNSLLRTFKGADIEPILRHFDKEDLFEELIELENSFFITKSDKHGTKEEIKARITNLLERLVESQIEPLEKTVEADIKHLNNVRANSVKKTEIKKAENRHKKSTKSLAELYKFKGEIKNYFIEPIVFPTIFSPSVKEKGFDIVIGNPPYVNTKLISRMNMTSTLKDEYGYCDDLYNHFTIRGMELLKQGGCLTYITSDTFLTIQTKENMRRLFLSIDKKAKQTSKINKKAKIILPPQQVDLSGKAQAVQTRFDFSTAINDESENEIKFDEEANCRLIEIINTPKAFAAMVDTAIFTIQKQVPKVENKVIYIDIRFPKAETFELTKDEWQKLKSGTDNYASWEKILEKVMSEIQLPISKVDKNQPSWDLSHTCDKYEVLRDVSTNIEKYLLPLVIYHQSLNYALFAPNKWNSKVFDQVMKPAFPTLEKWWDKIKTSRKINDNREEIQEYIENLNEGDVTLLGLITDGGQGLATGDNGKLVGVIEGTKIARRIRQTRPIKLMKAVEDNPEIKSLFDVLGECEDLLDYSALLKSLTEKEIRNLFDKIKKIFGLRVFGKGFLYRIISPDEIYDVCEMSNEQKEFGIISSTEVFVPYDKGDKDGNRWFLETPYYICWSSDVVKWLKDNSGKSRSGMPVVRNPQFYFRTGFCWTDINTVYLKCRLKEASVYDVVSMSLFNQCNENILSTRFIVTIINSVMTGWLVEEFLNNSSHFQINDARRFPIKIPTTQQLEDFNEKFDQCFDIKNQQFAEEITESEANALLKPIEKEIDELVEKLYGINE